MKPFVRTQKQKQLLTKVALRMCFNQSILQLYQTYKSLYENVQAGSLIQSKIKVLIFQSTKYKVHVDLLLMGEEGKRHYVLIKYFNTFMYDHTLDRGRKHFCRYFLQAYSTEQRLKC